MADLARFRPAQSTLTLMTVATVLMALLGLYALRSAPALLIDGELVTIREGIEITRIAEVPVQPVDLWKLPAFKSPVGESRWWTTQDELHQAIDGQAHAIISFTDSAGMSWEVLADVGRMPIGDIATRLGLVYIVAAIYVFASVSVYRHHKRTAGFLVAFFLSSTALYLVSVAAVVHRPIAMDPWLTHLLVYVFFVASTGQIAIVHFSLIFPERKPLLRRYPWVPAALYAYAALISVLYVTGLIGLTTTLPFLVVLLFLMMGSFVHSMTYLDDEFMRKQVRITFMAVLLVAAFFVMAVVLPWPASDSLVNNYALFSLMLPFGLILALDNQRLYYDRLDLEYNTRMEKERLHRELHDTVLNDLASIAIAVEGAERCSSDHERLRSKLDQIKSNTAESSRQLRNFLWVIDDRQNTWDDIANSLRRLGYDLLSDLDIAFDLEADIARDAHGSAPTPALKHAIYRTFREALINVAKHAQATRVHSHLALSAAGLELSVEDNGIGMEIAAGSEEGHGLVNMRQRLREQGGTLHIASRPGEGTRIVMRFALPNAQRVASNEVFTAPWPSANVAD